MADQAAGAPMTARDTPDDHLAEPPVATPDRAGAATDRSSDPHAGASKSDRRYGFYLRPSFAMCLAQAQVHELLCRQYHLDVAGRFMPHATIKGFFRSEAPAAEMVQRLDDVLGSHRAVAVHNGGVVPLGPVGIGLAIQRLADGSRNEPLQSLHEAALGALMPLVHPSCDFTPMEWLGPRFEAHLTLAMADIPPTQFDEILRFIRDGEPIGPTEFTADTVQLFVFESDEWSGRWWDTLGWELLHSWRLG